MSLLTGNIAQRWRQHRFNPIRSLSPQVLSRALDEFDAGHLRTATLLWEIIFERDDILCIAGPKRCKAVSRRPWSILKVEDSAAAEAHAATLTEFYNNITVVDASDENRKGGFRLLLQQMMSAVFYKYAVHEILWAQRGGKLRAEFRFAPIYFFENRTGKLRFTGPENRADGVALEDGEWMVTVAEGIGEALSIAYMFKRLSLQDWLAFNEKFSIPGVLGRTTAAKDSDAGRAMRDSVLSYASEWVGVVYNDDGTVKDPIATIPMPNGGGQLPQEMLANYMDRMIGALVRGADLATVSQQDSVGASLQSDEINALLEDDCALVSETLQTQLDRHVIRMVHGDEKPLAFIVINPPSGKDLTADLAIDNGLALLGVRQDPADLAERYGRQIMESPAPQPPAANEAEYFRADALRNALAKDMEPVALAIEAAMQAGDSAAVSAALRKISANLPSHLEAPTFEAEVAREFLTAITTPDEQQ
jgi:phage gp29-like protein